MSYKTKPVVEAVLLFFGSMATEGSALRWSYDHRYHHAFVDTDKDPYSIKKGFWYAHFGWMLEKQKPIENKVVADLVKNPLVHFQHRFYVPLMFATNILATVVLGLIFHDMWGAFVFGWLLRLFFLHHFTWFINSLAHTWGARTFCQELSAVDNYFIALLTFGEGYHNYHHTFAYDYRNGIRWFHFDPTKWIIWTLSKVGLAYKLKKNQRYFIEERILLDRKKLLLDKLQSSYNDQKEALKETVSQLTESAQTKLRLMRDLSERYHVMKKAREKKHLLLELKAQIKTAKKDLKKEWQYWGDMARDIAAKVASSNTTVSS
jgi:stearoyl-CoA desaturase (delta-9 desaturase)